MKKILLVIALCGFVCLGFRAYSGYAATKDTNIQTAEPTPCAGDATVADWRIQSSKTEAVWTQPEEFDYYLSQEIGGTRAENGTTAIYVEAVDATQYAPGADSEQEALLKEGMTVCPPVVVAEPTPAPVE